MTRPVRIQLSRRKGFNLQAVSLATNGLPAVNVARPGPWGNPFVVGKDGTRDKCVRFYWLLLNGRGALCLTCKASIDDQKAARRYVVENYKSLRGKNLACWCKGSPCHAEVLLELASEQ